MSGRIVVIQGAPASGKTILYNKLQSELPHIIFLSKDTIKEFLFETQPKGDREWSRTLGKASMAALYAMAEVFLKDGKDVVLEAAFYSECAKDDLRKLNAPVLEFYCKCDEALRLARFKERAVTTRHPAHADTETTSEALSIYEPIGIGQTITIETTEGINDSFADILQRVKHFLDDTNKGGYDETTN